ncbi:MAG: hypothetical protein HC936_15600 [Leptolyngbyaceae cyanobacterium SU_3_3]|nr:hypothetical protein [Leptolyngbyaceae cyanobacterium SU_3_3]NJR51463.1 hypothetical protein [Leptolyngbyaceae cyanobacterium CSU_1_3]
MAGSTSLPSEGDAQVIRLAAEIQVWDSLKRAIADSSGFRSWKMERDTDKQVQELSLDTLVHNYLRETLETLAY